MAREFVKLPLSFSQGGMDGSSGVDHALWMMSIEVAGSERLHTAHISISIEHSGNRSLLSEEEFRVEFEISYLQY